MTAAGTVALHVDWTRCRGRGLCTELFAERLARDEWGYPIARDGSGTRDVPVRPDERAAAADAVAMCPLQALRLVGE
ncbi:MULTISPECIES: ferredoxin [unclassified Curtobacterium]|uniref:ferredoxin n=1 Tax=unclassified Curtobacterium TaxID=257496 RepID=UPI000F4898C1|nr:MULTISPECIES: ferredoxin [unclassified Curtobacterium]ROQ04103.1 4Fe-4S single cluster protein [Curtobacterium sp. PhB171]ROQ19368.1 4Fe-4S single cluster protein [Curtobacterium sp. PhB170]ROS32730.1 4Fe-4S single cluster protein [Curtobacterium sp. PhB131]ROS64293.1 4Fe-4S single cluster protein [Curtobacterium sp. PhB141]